VDPVSCGFCGAFVAQIWSDKTNRWYSKLYCGKKCKDAVDYRRHAASRAAGVRANYRKKKQASPRFRCNWCSKPVTEIGRRTVCSDTCRRALTLWNGRETEHKRRAAERCRVTPRDIRRLRARYHGKCAYCAERDACDIDHLIPIYRGGRHAIGNLVPACAACNKSKTDKLVIEWRYGRRRPKRRR
jgi:5-methylcytosine-specific restriction endonuclease McrA